MNIFYLVLILLVAGYVLFKKRKFDFYSLSFFSTVAYYYPAFLGQIRKGENAFVGIDSRVYLCLYIHIVMLFICMMLTDRFRLTLGGKGISKEESEIKDENTCNMAVLIVEVIGVLLLVYTFTYYGGFQLDFNKMQLLSEANRLTEYLKYIALYSFAYSFTHDGKYRKLLRFLGIILIGYTFLLGHRSFIVIGILAIFMNFMRERNDREIRLATIVRKYWIFFLALIIVAAFFLFIKNVFAALMSGQYQLVQQRLSDPDYYVNALLSSEANSILSNLQSVCTSGMSYSIFDYFFIFVGLMPVIGGTVLSFFGITSFETNLNLTFNEHLDEGLGLGSTFLGEGYATGGLFFLACTLCIVFLIISSLQKHEGYAKTYLSRTWMLLMLVYMTFYIHRNSAFFLLVTARAYLYIWFLCAVLNRVIKGTLGRRIINGRKAL